MQPLDLLFERVIEGCSYVISIIIAIARLVLWTILLFVMGLQEALFTRSEICGIDIKALPLRCDRDDVLDKISYVDRLKLENPDLDLNEDDDILGDDKDTKDGE